MDWNYTNILYYVIGAVFLLLIIAAFVVLRKKRQPQRPHNPYVEALKLLIDGEQKEAFARLQESIRSGFAPTDAYIRLGTMLRDAGDPVKALQIHKSLTVKTDLTRKEKLELFLNLALDYSALGKSKQAVNVLETALKKMHLKEPAVFSVLAKEYHLLGSIEAAYNQLKEMAKLGVIGDRELSLYLSSAGEQMFDDSNEKEARKLLNRALKHHPENAAALLILATGKRQRTFPPSCRRARCETSNA
jgi:lipopolysaccharide biosynthesis regulator YciM